MLNDEEIARKAFRAMEDFIEFRAKSEALCQRVFVQGKAPKIV